MKHIRSRRRFKAILIVLLAISIVAFFESRIEAFAPQIKGMAESRIENAFGNKLNISIGALDGGIIRPIALKDIDILSKEGNASSRLVEIRSIVSNYHIWDLAFPAFMSKEPYMAIDFSTKNREISGLIKLEGAIENASIEGCIRFFDGDDIEVTGAIRNGLMHLILKPRSGLVRLEANFAAEGVLLLKIILNHITLHTFDIVGEIDIKNIAVKNTINDKKGSLEGEIELKNLILNYKPFLDGKASYRISGNTLEITSFNLGNIFYVNGEVGLAEPHRIDITATTDNMNLGQILSSFNPRYTSFLNGTMNSKWELKGVANKLKSKIRLEVRKGEISGMNFEFLSANLKGDGPLISIEDSRVTRQSGSFAIAGDMDMRKIGKDSLFENLKITSGENTLIWDSYDTAKWQDVREFRMSKKIMGDFNVGFKKFINDEKVDESTRDRDQYEIGYSLHPNDSIKIKFGDNDNFFGLEHKDKF